MDIGQDNRPQGAPAVSRRRRRSTKNRGSTRRPSPARPRLMDDKSIPAIFEAAFEYDGIRIRVDVLERLDATPGDCAK